MITINKVELIKVGNSRGFLIPSDYIKQNGLEEGKLYSLVIGEAVEQNGSK